HRAAGLHAHVAGAVVGGERLHGQRRQAGEGGEGNGGHGKVAEGGLHAQAPWYSIRRRSMASSPSSRWRMRTGVGTPLAIHRMVSSLPPLVRWMRRAS